MKMQVISSKRKSKCKSKGKSKCKSKGRSNSSSSHCCCSSHATLKSVLIVCRFNTYLMLEFVSKLLLLAGVFAVSLFFLVSSGGIFMGKSAFFSVEFLPLSRFKNQNNRFSLLAGFLTMVSSANLYTSPLD